MATSNLTAQRLRELIGYDPETGVFTRRVRLSNRSKMQNLGTVSNNGYFRFSVDGRNYFSHRLAWLYMNGNWPEHDIDHINGIRNDNRIANLRAVSRALNLQNMREAKTNSHSGLLGVALDQRGKWAASIQTFGERTRLGRFDTKEQAYAAYLSAKRRLHETNAL